MTSNIIDKQELRKVFKKKRASLSKSEVEQKSYLINQNFIQNLLPQFLNQKPDAIFAIYIAMLNEVSTKVITKHFQKNNIKFSYPRIVAPDQPLDFILAQKALEQETLEQKKQGFSHNNLYKNIIEPIEGEKIIPDFLIIPLVSFDDQLNRIGMGGGFFDRTIEHLKKQNPKIVTTALAYDLQGSRDVIEVENTDQRPDFIATEEQILSSN